jgi:uncharacterized protein involved in outer membrane biogenesis
VRKNKKRTRKQKLLLSAKIFGALLVLGIALVFVFRESLLQQAIAKISRKMDTDYDCRFTIKTAQFEGLSGVAFEDVCLSPKHADTLFRVQSIKARINFWRLFTGDVQLGSLEAKNGFMQLVRNENGRNFDAFLKKKDTVDTGEKTNYARTAYRLLHRALNLVPTDMRLENLTLRMDDRGKKATLRLDQLQLAEKQMETSIQVQTNTSPNAGKSKDLPIRATKRPICGFSISIPEKSRYRILMSATTSRRASIRSGSMSTILT